MTAGGSFLVQDIGAECVFTPEDLTEQQRLIGKTAADFVVNEVLPHAEHLEHHKDYAMMRSLLKKAAEVGLTGIDIPEEYGGMELDKVSSVVVTEHTARYGSFSNVYNVHSGIGATPIVWFGTPAQKEKYLPKIAAAEWVSAYCLTEAQAGSDSRNARCRADLTPDGKHYVLNGEKMWISNGGFADLFIVFAKIGGEKFTGFIVEKSFGGVQPGGEERKMGLHGASTTSLALADCKVPVENLLGEIGRGHIIAFNCLNVGRLKLCAGAVGGMRQTLQHSIKYAKERVAFGKPIACFGLIQHKIAEMAVRIFATEGIAYRTAGLIDSLYATMDRAQQDAMRKAIEEYAAECSVCKVVGSENLSYCVDEAVQIYGGYGYHADYPPERAYRDARINRIFEGTNEINRLLITNMLLKRATGGQLPLLSAGQALREEITSGGISAGDAVANLKKIFLLAAGTAFQRFGRELGEQQEVVAAISNIVCEAYTAETALRRTEKLPDNVQAADLAAVHIHDALHRAVGEARTVLHASAEGDTLRTLHSVLVRLSKQEPLDTVAARRRICARLLEWGKYQL